MNLVEKEIAHQAFSSEDKRFIGGLIEDSDIGCTLQDRLNNGWYPQLFYRTVFWPDDRAFQANFGAGACDALVADVHTDVPCACGDPGSVLHEAVGRPHLLVMAVDNGLDRFICAGPVFSHYEFESIGEPRRISDEEWRGRGLEPKDGILQGARPPDLGPNQLEGLQPPPWTKSFLVRQAAE